MSLTTKQVRHAGAGRHSDGAGLYLLVKPSGARSWVLRVQCNGRRRDLGIGSVTLNPIATSLPLHRRKTLTLQEAREKARIARELAKAGVDPASEWRREEKVVPTFEAAAREYHAQVSKGWRNGKHREQWLNTLKAYVFPVLGPMDVESIDAAHVQSALTPIWLAKPETARRVRQRIGVVLDYAKGKGWRSTEAPMRAVGQLLGGIRQPKGSHFSAMPYAELPKFMAKLRAGDPSAGKLALEFLILTAARSGEVRKARWKCIDLDQREWHVPAENTKTGRVHIVPLTDAAVYVLEQARSVFGQEPEQVIFPGLKNGSLSDATLAKALRVNGGGGYTVHGFRSAFRDWAADAGHADAWAEAALAHGNPDRTEAAYKRTTYFAQRRETLMPAWTSFCSGGGEDG